MIDVASRLWQGCLSEASDYCFEQLGCQEKSDTSDRHPCLFLLSAGVGFA